MSNYIPDFVAVDLETTGLDPSKSDIIEVGATIFTNGIETSHFSSLIRPTKPLPDRISALTGLTAGELDWAKSFSEIMPEFLKFIRDLPLVAHNAEFDMGFLSEKLPKIEMELPPNKIWDNLKLGVLLYPEISSYGLESLANVFKVPFKKTHRASSDCRITGLLFVEFLKNIPSILSRELWKEIIEDYLGDNPLRYPIEAVYNHPNYNEYLEREKPDCFNQIDSNRPSAILNEITSKDGHDMLIKVSYEDEQEPDRSIFSSDIFKNGKRHYVSFPTTQYPGDFWGISKQWNEIADRYDDLALYPGKKRILCKRQIKMFIDDNPGDRLSMNGYEVAVLKAFAHTSEEGNFSRLSWWIWNNLVNLANAISFLSATNCESDKCPYINECFYQKALRTAEGSKLLAFPYKVMKEESGLPVKSDVDEQSVLTFFTPEGIFKDSLNGGVFTFSISYCSVLLRKIEKILPEEIRSETKTIMDKIESIIGDICSDVDNLINESDSCRTHKGRSCFLFIEKELLERSMAFIEGLENFNILLDEFLGIAEDNSSSTIDAISRMLILSKERLAEVIEGFKSERYMLCLDKIDSSSQDTCRFMFFPRIFENSFFELPSGVSRINYLTHHINDSEDWQRIFSLLGREKAEVDYHDMSREIPEGNKIYLVPSSVDDEGLSKKKLLSIKGDVILDILDDFPGRFIVIVKGSQELLNFKYRLSPRLKSVGYWPLFQKQDGPKGLLIKEFSKHQQVAFFGLTDLVNDIWQFENPPENIIFESLHLTSLQDPTEAFIKNEMEKMGKDYYYEYLKPRIHFTLTRGLNLWQHYLQGQGKIFILDEQLVKSKSSLNFLKELKGEIINL